MSDKESATKDLGTDLGTDLPAGANVKVLASNSPGKPARRKQTGGPKGPEPTRYGDWGKDGITSDF